MTNEWIKKQAKFAKKERECGNVASALQIEHALWHDILRAIASGYLEEIHSVNFIPSDVAAIAQAATDYAEYKGI